MSLKLNTRNRHNVQYIPLFTGAARMPSVIVSTSVGRDGSLAKSESLTEEKSFNLLNDHPTSACFP